MRLESILRTVEVHGATDFSSDDNAIGVYYRANTALCLFIALPFCGLTSECIMAALSGHLCMYVFGSFPF